MGFSELQLSGSRIYTSEDRYNREDCVLLRNYKSAYYNNLIQIKNVCIYSLPDNGVYFGEISVKAVCFFIVEEH